MKTTRAAFMGDHKPSTLDPVEIRQCLRNALESRTFSDSPRCRTFLEFIVTQALAGSTDSLKESVIAIDVFGKESNFDSRSNTIVRTTANRLRAKLSEYYSAEGAQDLIEISLIAGSYIPVFKIRPSPLAEPPSERARAEISPSQDIESPPQAPSELPIVAGQWSARKVKAVIITAGLSVFGIATVELSRKRQL